MRSSLVDWRTCLFITTPSCVGTPTQARCSRKNLLTSLSTTPCCIMTALRVELACPRQPHAARVSIGTHASPCADKNATASCACDCRGRSHSEAAVRRPRDSARPSPRWRFPSDGPCERGCSLRRPHLCTMNIGTQTVRLSYDG